MSRELSFSVDVVPPKATAQQKGACIRGGFIKFFKKKKVVQAENMLAALFKPYAPEGALEGPLKLSVRWYFPYRKSEKKSVVKNGLITPHTVRPDLDNIEKSLIDVLTALQFWRDDSQVCEKHTSKHWAPSGKITVEIESLDKE